ncbi:PREDICTED: uncharacterized protein LOC108801366 [Nanorana parkeri]|uniref:uncharacterized protein LOC108801366 n=1 Tax=Nanorana parkeri TaxID=125878 RepID=UPI000854DE5F|nr:PREDICTED: uncharacterized protein LOC108801366 [Nanorana parkeri]
MDIGQLRDNIGHFSLDSGYLGNQGYEKVLLQLFGYTGHGKSSFINSCKYVLEEGERFAEPAEARETHHGLTMSRNAYPLTETITMVDNRGCSKMDDFERSEVYAQLGNFIPIGQKVNWKDNFSAMMEDLENSELEPNYTDFIVPIFVYSVRQQIPDAEMQEVKKFMENCVRMTGIVPIIVLTFKTRGDYLDIEKRFRLMGAEVVIAIENYTTTSNIKTLGRTTDILMVIDSALRNVKFRLEQPRNPRRERVERKKFLLNYIHQTTTSSETVKEIERERERVRERTIQLLHFREAKNPACEVM